MLLASTPRTHEVDPMTWLPIVLSVVVAVVAGMVASVDAPIWAFSKARAEELETEGRSGAAGLVRILDDPAAYLNSVLLMRVLTETASIVLVALVVADHLDGLWPRFGVAVAIMVVVSFVLIGVGPRTLGRQHAESIALASTVPVIVLTRLLGPLPQLLILLGNAVTPGKGFREGPFASEVEVRELVDLAAASSIIANSPLT
jgi:CBS domain containing-hemolysin-like protein